MEQMNIAIDFNPNITLTAASLRETSGLYFIRSEPTYYPTASMSEMETQILPTNWTENGIMISGKIGSADHWTYHAGLVNGLDGSAFNSANWIKRGNQQRFELVNAENFAV